jgi:hypothetical protein
MKAGYMPIDIKFEDRSRYCKAFDEYYGNNNLAATVNLFAEYIEARLDNYLKIIG